MSNTIIYSIYKYNNNKCCLINITIFIFRQKIKERKNHINLNFFRTLHGFSTS